MRVIHRVICILMLTQIVFGQIFINEIDYDQPGTDAAEFIELAGVAGVYDSVVVELVNGNDNSVYRSAELGSILLADESDGFGFYVIGVPGVLNLDVTPAEWPATNSIQNGSPDAIVLRVGGNIIDAVAYEGEMTDADGNPMESIVGYFSGLDSSMGRNGFDEGQWTYGPFSPGTININQIFTYPPVADAGPGQLVMSGAAIVLSGAGSIDSDGSIVSYLWQQTEGPSATILDTNLINTEVILPEVLGSEIWIFSLTVTDDKGAQDIDEVEVIVNPLPITINEVLQNPSVVGDSEGEWFELYNPSYADVQLQDWSIRDNGSDIFFITEPLLISAHGFMVFGTNTDINTNGNVAIDYQYSSFTLGNSADEIILVYPNGVVADSVAYDGGPNFPDPSGTSMALLAPSLDNSIGSNWAESSTAFGLGDLGTPGLPNFLSNIVTTPNVLSFDTVFVDESGDLTLSISNDGNAPLQIDTIYTSNPLFSISFTDSLIENSADLIVTFAPTEFGEVLGILYISSNDPDDGLKEVPLSGFGYFLSPDIELSNTSINFGGVMDGLTKTELFQIYNLGEGVLELDTIFCTDYFSVSSTNGAVLPGDSLSLEVSFSPDDEAGFEGTLTIVAGNDPDEDTLTVALSGIGTAQAPLMTVSTDELYFGVVVPNETVIRQITIYNGGMLDLEIEELTISGSELFTTTFSDASLAPGESIDAEFQFLSAEMLSQAEATATISASGVDDLSVELQAGYFGPVWYVTLEGDNIGGDGSLILPFATIQHGIDVAAPHDTVLVQPGTYVENINFNGKNIIVGSLFLTTQDASHISSTIIDGNQNGSVVIFNSGEDSTSVLSGFNICNGNTLTSGGGGILCLSSSPSLLNLLVNNNTAIGYGGGVLVMGGQPTLESINIFDNTGNNNGGGIAIINALVNMSNMNIERNWSHDYGGGVWCENSTMYFDNVIICNNEAMNGGGMYCRSSSQRIENGVICNNLTSGDGGGIFYDESEVELNYTLINENSAGRGGGIYFNTYSNISRLKNVTLSGNSANEGGGIFLLMSHPKIVNSILWDNFPEEIYFWAEGLPDSITVEYSDVQGGETGIETNNFGTVIWLDGNITADPWFCDPTTGDYRLAQSGACVGAGVEGVNMGAFGVGCTEPVAINEVSIPTQYMLEQNYPNPFNPTTNIKYALPEQTKVMLTIFDIRGQEVTTLMASEKPPGNYEVQWRGLNHSGNQVSTGMYFARLQSGKYSKTIKMVYLR